MIERAHWRDVIGALVVGFAVGALVADSADEAGDEDIEEVDGEDFDATDDRTEEPTRLSVGW